MRILITGSSGFSGAVVAARLASAGNHVLTPGRGRLPHDFDAVVHVAATSPAPGVTDLDIYRDNVAYMENVLWCAIDRGATHFVFFSSVSVYGDIETPIVDEGTPVRSPGYYGRTKLYGEDLLRVHADAIPSVSLRLPAIVGRGARRNWPARVLASAARGERISAFNRDGAFNNAVDVDELATFVVRLLTHQLSSAQVVTLGASGAVTVAEALDILLKGRSAQVDFGSSDRTPFTISSERAISLGYRPSHVADVLLRYAKSEARVAA